MAWNDENLQPSVTNSEDAALVALGQRGFVFTADTNAVTGNFAAIQILTTPTAFSALTALNSTVGTLAAGGVSLLAGTVIFGPFTGFTLSSGSVIAYKA